MGIDQKSKDKKHTETKKHTKTKKHTERMYVLWKQIITTKLSPYTY